MGACRLAVEQVGVPEGVHPLSARNRTIAPARRNIHFEFIRFLLKVMIIVRV
jgi:hypothetical protein